MDQLAYYAKRAQAAYAAAEAATDPCDKAAFKAAAQTWERLSRSIVSTYSLDPERRDLAALKKDAVAPLPPPDLERVAAARYTPPESWKSAKNETLRRLATIEF